MGHMRKVMAQVRQAATTRADRVNRRIVLLLIYTRIFDIRRHIHGAFMVALRHDECKESIEVFEIQDHSILDEDNSGN